MMYLYHSQKNSTLGNQYFQFKQFKVSQAQSAMKVCTDSCVFGAAINLKSCRHVLDIGTGTGLLALMMAQRSDATIDAVEIDEASAGEASANIAQSPWKDRVHVVHSSIQTYGKEKGKYYDLIVSNPPFYSDSLKSDNASKNNAHHQVELNMEDLLASVGRLIKPDGRFVVLLPAYESEIIREEAMAYGLYPSALLKIKDNAKAKVIREVTEFRHDLTLPSVNELVIKKEDGVYSENFISLLKEYYLHL